MKWNKWVDEKAAAGRRALRTLWWCGVRQGGLAVDIGNRLMDMMLRPAMSYGYEIANPSTTAFLKHERVQLAAARQLLRAPIYTKSEALRGELGWWTTRGRMHQRQLAFYHTLQSLPPSSLAHRVFAQRMLDANRREKANETMLIPGKSGRRRKNMMRRYGYCNMVKKTLIHYQIQPQKYFHPTTKVKKEEWKKIVREAIQDKEEKDWRNTLEKHANDEKNPSPAAKWYLNMKKSLSIERYLTISKRKKVKGNHHDLPYESAQSVKGRRLRTQMRTWSAPLAAILCRVGRKCFNDPSSHTPPSSKCLMCNEDTDETPTHLLCRCTAYDNDRARLFRRIEDEFSSLTEENTEESESKHWNEMNDEEKAHWLLCYDEDETLVQNVNNYLVHAFGERDRVMKQLAAEAKKGKNNTSRNIGASQLLSVTSRINPLPPLSTFLNDDDNE